MINLSKENIRKKNCQIVNFSKKKVQSKVYCLGTQYE